MGGTARGRIGWGQAFKHTKPMKPTAEERRAASPVQAHARKVAEQRAETQRHQVAALGQLDCLRGLPESVLQALAPHCILRAFSPGVTILNERAASESLYLVLRGSIALTLRDRSRREVMIGAYSRGDCFGEGPLFGDLFRGAQVRTTSTCYLLQIPLDAVRAAMFESNDFAAKLRAIYRRHLVAGTLGRVPMFSTLSPLERNNIANLLVQHQYERDRRIITQGQSGAALYLIESGQCAVERDGVLIAHLDEGAFFGEISLITGQPHNADVRALTPVEVLELPREAFAEVVKRQPALQRQVEQVVEQRLNARQAPGEQHIQLVGSAIQHGLLRGTHLLVRDTRLCPGDCQRCVDACTARHGAPRLRTNGVRHNELDVIDSCRQCRVGAECVEACPEQAIQWNNNGALVITDACTGCAACVPACPYDAVTMVDLPKTEHSPLWRLWQQFTRSQLPTIPLEAVRPTQRADKCDYCHGYGDLACVSACPTGALRLVPVEELFPL